MPNLGQVLRSEIVRLAKREANAQTGILRKALRANRGSLVALRRELTLLQRQVAVLARNQAAGSKAESTDKTSARAWISGKGVRALRRKLRLTQLELATLAHVSPIAVFKWEKQEGKLQLRRKNLASVMELRKLGAREARARLSGKA